MVSKGDGGADGNNHSPSILSPSSFYFSSHIDRDHDGARCVVIVLYKTRVIVMASMMTPARGVPRPSIICMILMRKQVVHLLIWYTPSIHAKHINYVAYSPYFFLFFKLVKVCRIKSINDVASTFYDIYSKNCSYHLPSFIDWKYQLKIGNQLIFSLIS